MTLDDFLRAFEILVDERDASDDDPGQGNYGCEDCRACNNCRFCIGCDSCEDCTYCDECLDCTSCTQSKRCVDCKKVSYCEDSRDCKGSRYLTLCVDCSDCVHCLACVGLEGGEFFVLNQKRSRKEYFALLRQLQELMTQRRDGGWRPPGIGLASDIFDPALGDRDGELSAAPWLEEVLGGGQMAPPYDPEYDDHRPVAELRGRGARVEPAHAPAREADHHADDRVRGRGEGGYPRNEPRAYDGRPEPAPARSYERDDPRGYERRPEPEPDRGYGRRPTRPERHEYDERGLPSSGRPASPGTDTSRIDERGSNRPRRESDLDRDSDWVSQPPAYGSSYDERADERTLRRPSRHSRQDYGDDLGRALDPDDDWGRELSPSPDYGRDGRDEGYAHDDDPRSSYPGEDSQAQTNANIPAPRKQEQPTQPFSRAAPRDDDRGDDRRVRASSIEDAAAPVARPREPSSPWLDEQSTQSRRKAKRGSLRRAGRPTRPSDRPGEGAGEGTGSGTGSGSFRTGSEGTHTGLRMGRKPKKRR